jgi:NAD(P)-dependent dehydrogenase (short-subunit alcohol dehydrogenase family)
MFPSSNRLPHGGARVALVTGAAHRIGRTIALTLAARGWDVAVHYGRSEAAATALAAEIDALGRRAIALRADLADEAQVRGLLPQIEALLGPVRCIVNNASLFEEDSAATFDYATLQRLSAVNLAAPLALARALYQSLPAEADSDESLRGVVINLLDQKLFNQNPDFFSYTLTKAALHTATTTLAQALAPRVRVAAVAPGLTLPSGTQSPAGFAQAHRHTPLGRASHPQDVADAVCYLAEASAVTGATLVVDGGQHLVPLPRDVMFMTGASPQPAAGRPA